MGDADRDHSRLLTRPCRRGIASEQLLLGVASSAAVGSSRTRTRGVRRIVLRAMASRCHWPPEVDPTR